jgi:hypothetical protein
MFIGWKCPANLSATERNSIKMGWKLREIKSCILQILSLIDLFIQRKRKKLKDVPIQINTSSRYMSHNLFFWMLQAANDVCMVFGSSSFSAKKRFI